MGHEIVYCDHCANRVAGVDFEKGKAFRAGAKVFCAACLPQVLPTLTPAEQNAVASRGGEGTPSSASRLKLPKLAPGSSSSTRMPPVRSEPEVRSRLPLILGGAACAMILVVAGVVLSSRSAPDPVQQPPATTAPEAAKPATAPLPTATPAPEEKKEDVPLREARESIERARDKGKAAPGDLDGIVAVWEEAARKAALTPLFKEASGGLQEAKDRRAAARPTPVEKPALAAPVNPSPKPSPTVSKTYLARWEAAMAKAASREIEGALAELSRAAAELSDEDGKREAQADLEDLKKAKAALAEGLALLLGASPGQTLQLALRGEPKRVEGTVVSIGSARVELKQGDATVFVEWYDVSAASLSPRNDGERRALAILCLAEGDRESAERLTGSPEAIPARYWDYSREAASKLPKLPPLEVEARRLFYGAERDFAKMETLPAAVAKYKALAENYAESRVVKGDLIRIQKRGEAGRDYVLLANVLRGAGTFAVGPAPRVEAAWASKSDCDPSVENCVEGEFAALPELTYRAWALLGGCCQESFTCYLQTTEGSDLHPKTRQKTSIDPGGGFASPLKIALSGLKKTHEEHKIKGSKSHPKIAARWEWIPIPLPKYAGPGAKKIRIISDQQGFSVGAIVVTSTRSAPPHDDELKEEAAKAKVVAPPPPEAKPWKPLFDGKTLEFLRDNGNGWRVENGTLVHIPGPGYAAQTRQEFEDVELRIRFELKDMENTWFKLRQGEAGGYSFPIFGDTIKSYEGKPHEIIFIAKGDQVTGLLDGKPTNLVCDGPSKRGCLQFSGTGKTLIIHSMETR